MELETTGQQINRAGLTLEALPPPLSLSAEASSEDTVTLGREVICEFLSTSTCYDMVKQSSKVGHFGQPRRSPSSPRAGYCL